MALWSTQPLNRHEYQEYFLRGKGGKCVGPTTLLHLCAVLKSESLNLSESSGPVLTYTGIVVWFAKSAWELLNLSRNQLRIMMDC